MFDDSVDRSKKVTVFWYTEMDGTGQKDSVDYSDDEMAVVLSVDSEDVCLVDMAGEITSLQVYNTSVVVTAGEEPQYLVEFKQSQNKNGFEYVVVTKGKIVSEKYSYHWMSENELNVLSCWNRITKREKKGRY